MLTIRELIKTLYNAFNQKLKNHRGNWEQNDPTADDYIKNRPFYTNGYTTIINNKTFTTTENYEWCSPFVFEVIEGETYKVVWDGKEYECVAFEEYGGIYIGNPSVANGAGNTGEPFFFYYYEEEGYEAEYAFCVKNSGAHVVSIYKQNVVKINKKYLPENLIPDLAPVATSGSYNDLSDTPTIYTDVVRYGTTQGLTTTQKKTSKTNIGAVGYDAYQNLATTDKTIARDNIGAVGYEKQTLTNAQKTQARTNIGAIAATDLVQSDWNTYTTTDPSFIKNRIIYDDLIDTVITDTQSISLSELLGSTVLADNGSYYAEANCGKGEQDVIKIFVIDGVEYNTTWLSYEQRLGVSTVRVKGCGNLSLIPDDWLDTIRGDGNFITYDKSDTGEEFCLIQWHDQATAGSQYYNSKFYLFSKTEGYSLNSIYKRIVNLKQLDSKLISNDIMRISDRPCYLDISETTFNETICRITTMTEYQGLFSMSTSSSIGLDSLEYGTKLKVLQNDGIEIITQVRRAVLKTSGAVIPVLGNAALGVQYGNFQSDVEDTGESWCVYTILGYNSASTYLIATTLGFGLVNVNLITEDLKQLDEKFIPNTIPIIQSASIGQTIMVKTVDENGKPTEWETTDVVKSINDTEPDENGNIDVNQVTNVVFINMDGELTVTSPIEEIIALFSSSRDYPGAKFEQKLYSMTNPMAPVPSYYHQRLEADVKQDYNTGEMLKNVIRIHFAPEVPDILIDRLANTIVLDPDWIAPAEREAIFASLVLTDESTNKKYRLHIVDKTLTMTEVE